MDGRVKQEFIRYIGKEMNSSTVRRVSTHDVKVMEIRRSMDVEAVHRISLKLGIGDLVPRNASVMVYSQLLDRPAINRMPDYLNETEILRYLGIVGIGTADLYGSLQHINEMEFAAVEEKLASFFLYLEKEKKTVIMDVTDTYFQVIPAEDNKSARKEGCSFGP